MQQLCAIFLSFHFCCFFPLCDSFPLSEILSNYSKHLTLQISTLLNQIDRINLYTSDRINNAYSNLTKQQQPLNNNKYHSNSNNNEEKLE